MPDANWWFWYVWEVQKKNLFQQTKYQVQYEKLINVPKIAVKIDISHTFVSLKFLLHVIRLMMIAIVSVEINNSVKQKLHYNLTWNDFFLLNSYWTIKPFWMEITMPMHVKPVKLMMHYNPLDPFHWIIVKKKSSILQRLQKLQSEILSFNQGMKMKFKIH